MMPIRFVFCCCIAGLMVSPVEAGSVAVAGLVQQVSDGKPVHDAEVVLSATRQTGGELAHDETTTYGIYNLGSSSVSDSVKELYLWCEYPYRTRPQMVRLNLSGNPMLRQAKPRPLKIPPARGPLGRLQATYSLIAVQETESLKVKLELQDKKQAFDAIQFQSVSVLARYSLGNKEKDFEKVINGVYKSKHPEWLPESIYSREDLLKLPSSDQFGETFEKESGRLNEVQTHLRKNALTAADIDYLLVIDPEQLPSGWLIDGRTPELIEKSLRIAPQSKGKGQLGLLPSQSFKFQLDRDRLLQLDELNADNLEVVDRWIMRTPAANAHLLYALLKRQKKLTESQRDVLYGKVRQLGPAVIVPPR